MVADRQCRYTSHVNRTSMGTRSVWLAVMVMAVSVAGASSAAADTWRPLETWRIQDGRVAPWAPPGTRVDRAYQGREVKFQDNRIVAPEPLACDGVTYEWIVMDADGLFEGNLPAPARQAAMRLGLGDGRIATLRAGCANASFDFHRTTNGELLLGLDNVVWRLRPARPASTPEEVVQELLITHFTHDMGFTRESVARKQRFLSTALRAGITRYFAAPRSPDEAPVINGDPFTDSQEYPDRFTLGATRPNTGRTTITVHFADSDSKRRVDYLLIRDGGRWVVDDLVDERGESLRGLLGSPGGGP